jgi:uncharacterized membrane protein
MTDLDHDDRIRRLEARLDRLERLLQGSPPVSPAAENALPPPSPGARVPLAPARPSIAVRPAAVRRPPPAANAEPAGLAVTTLLGWVGAMAMVLAAAYLIRLAIDSGWLTPLRQLGVAVMGGFALIVAGLVLRQADRTYAGLLPAAGVVILYLSVYAAHLYYHFIDAGAAVVFTALVSVATLVLGAAFESDVYAVFAVFGSYSAPFLMPSLRNNLTDLVVYFSLWNVVYCVHAIWSRSRVVYLLALYLALVGFDVIWKTTAADEWTAALVFQFVQFVLFSACAVSYSLREGSPMSGEAAFAHLPALLIFYGVQYALLKQHVPAWAPWIAAASLGFLAGCYLAVRAALGEVPDAGRMLVSAYAALVLFHAGYLESVPSQWAPWVAFLLMPVAAVLWRGEPVSVGWPVVLVCAVVFVINYLRVLTGLEMSGVPAPRLLMALYAAELYLGYYLARRTGAVPALREPLLYSGHIAAMAWAVHVFDNRFAISLAWGMLALACLMVSLQVRDKALGRSSLLVFAATAMKMFLYDLSGAYPLLRIASLVVLGVTFYLGGWLYRKVAAMEG